MIQKKIIEELSSILPPIITREEASRATGGFIASRTLANKDCAGTGPDRRVRIGRKTGYLRDSFLMWLARQVEVDDE